MYQMISSQMHCCVCVNVWKKEEKKELFQIKQKKISKSQNFPLSFSP